MKKIIPFLAIVIASITTATIVKSSNNNDLLLANVEALSNPENADGYTPGYKSGYKWVLGGITITCPLEADLERILCCISSRQMDACDFSQADPRCK